MFLIRQALRWFKQPDSPEPLAVLRIGVSLFCLLSLWVVRKSLLDIYGQYGFVQWAITRGTLPVVLPHLGNVSLLLGRLGLSANQSVYILLGVYAVSLILLLAGVATHWTATLAWCLHLLLMYAGAGLLYGMDYFTHIALFYCIIMPVGDALSIPVALGWRTSKFSISAGVTRKMLQLQMCIIYGSSGLEKASGIQWWNGEAIWRALTLPVFHRFDVSWIAFVPSLAAVAGWSVLAIECGYSVMMWSGHTRVLWFCLVIAMHFGIGLFMGMWLFALIMIVMNVGAFGYDVWKDCCAWRYKAQTEYIPVAA